MPSRQLIENAFFFALLGGVAFLIWKIFAPFTGALAFAAIIATICYPLYERMFRLFPRCNKTLAALFAVGIVIIIVVAPLAILSSFILREALSVYSLVDNTSQYSFVQSAERIEMFAQQFVPGFSLDIAQYVQKFAGFIASHLVTIFANTASTIFFFFLSLIASFYFFRDGKEFTQYLVQISPLKDSRDSLILRRLATAVRSVALGTVLVAIIQGTLTGIGLSLFGFERYVLWGSFAAIGALIPGVGTTIVFIPAVIYLIIIGSHVVAFGVAIWGVIAVGLIDNMIGPYLMSRGNTLHPFLILLSVLGGISLFGPVGFILGPVILSLFTVLVELYSEQVSSK